MIRSPTSRSPTRMPPAPRSAGVDLDIDEGELCLVVGRDRARARRPCCGPSTGWCRTSPGATSPATVTVAGRTTRDTRHASWPTWWAWWARTRRPASSPTPWRTSWPTPWRTWGSPPDAMRRRVEDTLDLLGLHELRHRPLSDPVGRPAAAGGHRRGPHRLAPGPGPRRADLGPRPGGGRGGAVVAGPPGPRRGADRGGGRAPPGAGAALRRPGACWSPGGGDAARGRDHRPRSWRTSPVAPPLVELGRWPAGRRCRFGPRRPAAGRPAAPGSPRRRHRSPSPRPGTEHRRDRRRYAGSPWPTGRWSRSTRSTSTSSAGEVVAVMGRNGSGKSTLLGPWPGAAAPTDGRVAGRSGTPTAGCRPTADPPGRAWCPRTRGRSSTGRRVADECATADKASRARPRHHRGHVGSRRARPARRPPPPRPVRGPATGPGPGRRAGPRARRWSCSTSPPAASTTRARTGSWSPCANWPPTGPRRRAGHPRRRAGRPGGRPGRGAGRGEVVADGPARDVVCHSPVFAPQVAKVLAPDDWLTVDEVRSGHWQAPHDRST